MSESQQRNRIIEAWINAIVHDGGIDRYDDLHIDQIDKSWKDPQVWFDAGLEAIRLAVATSDRLELDLTVALAWSLQTEEASPIGDFTQRQYLESQANWSRPSLCLFYRGKEPWAQIDIRTPDVQNVVIKRADPSGTGVSGIKYWCYIEFTQSDEPNRSVSGWASRGGAKVEISRIDFQGAASPRRLLHGPPRRPHLS